MCTGIDPGAVLWEGNGDTGTDTSPGDSGAAITGTGGNPTTNDTTTGSDNPTRNP